MTTTKHAPRVRAPKAKPEGRYRVLLHNDDVHEMDFVVECLLHVFAFTRPEAWAVMSEAHCTGVALCQIEGRERAVSHRDQLRSFGLSSTVERDGD